MAVGGPRGTSGVRTAASASPRPSAGPGPAGPYERVGAHMIDVTRGTARRARGRARARLARAAATAVEALESRVMMATDAVLAAYTFAASVTTGWTGSPSVVTPSGGVRSGNKYL